MSAVKQVVLQSGPGGTRCIGVFDDKTKASAFCLAAAKAVTDNRHLTWIVDGPVNPPTPKVKK